MKKIIIIFLLLIFPNILFADCAWVLWKYSKNVYSMEPIGYWSLVNALNSRNECLDALLKEHIGFYEHYLDDPNYEVYPKLPKTELNCLQSFHLASASKSVLEACKTLLTSFIMRRTNKEGIKSELRWKYANEEARQILKEADQMKKEGKTDEEIRAYKKASDLYNKMNELKIEFWCLPVGIDPKTIGNE